VKERTEEKHKLELPYTIVGKAQWKLCAQPVRTNKTDTQ